MSWSDFETRAPGKWVLAGEHAVLRGATAVALPHPQFSLKMTFRPDGDSLRAEPAELAPILLDLIDAIADEREQGGSAFERPRGVLSVDSGIPIGAGLGSSAALCVALTRWLSGNLGLRDEEQVAFARRLEHRFHGRSSGMDVAVVAANEAISFVMDRGAQPLGIKHLPTFTFHDCKLRARTSECIVRVDIFREEKPFLAVKTDEKMGVAARLAMEGLVRFDAEQREGRDTSRGLGLIANAMKEAQECFYTWGLVPGEAKRIEDSLMHEGALGVKMTGAGGGGFLVALWPSPKSGA